VAVFRLNMSHGEHAGHQAAYDHIRLIAERLVKPIAVLADLCGPKIRTGKFEGDGIDLLEGDEIKIIMGQGLGWGGVGTEFQCASNNLDIRGIGGIQNVEKPGSKGLHCCLNIGDNTTNNEYRKTRRAHPGDNRESESFQQNVTVVGRSSAARYACRKGQPQ